MERAQRSTRGTRMTELIGEAAEMDKAFWGSTVWDDGDGSENESFEDEEEARPDEFDSDFNDTETDESDEDEDGQLRAQQRRERAVAAKSGPGYKEPAKPARKRPQRSSTAPLAPPQKMSKAELEPQKLSVTLRQSTQSKSSARAKEILAAKARAPVKVTRPPIPKKEYSQRDLLLEALDTEIVNFKWLKSQHMAEEERNRLEARVAKPTQKIARTILSNRKSNTITFVGDNSWPPIFNSNQPLQRRGISYGTDSDDETGDHKQASLVCAVTGLPARYRDPLTGLPYHDLNAFQIIRGSNPNQMK